MYRAGEYSEGPWVAVSTVQGLAYGLGRGVKGYEFRVLCSPK